MIKLDGIARRLVICPPDVPRDHLLAIIATAEIDAIVSDGGTRDAEPLGVPLHVRCSAAIKSQGELPSASRMTEWVMLTSGTTGVPKLVAHNVASLTAPIKPGTEATVWGTFYRRYGGMQIFFPRGGGGGSLILSSADESVTDHLAQLAKHGVTHISGTPSHWWRVLMGPAATLITPRYFRLSGEIAGQAVLDDLRAAYPQAGFGYDGGRRRTHRQCRFDRRFHRIQRPFGLRRHQSVDARLHAFARPRG
jgi:non-ribosomal peptide synthetase component F